MMRSIRPVAILFALPSLLNSTAHGDDKDARVFQVPGKAYGLSLDLKGFKIDSKKENNDGTGLYVMASNKKTGISLSFWMEPAAKKGDSKVCRNTWWAKETENPIKPAHAQKRTKGDFAIVDYDTNEPLEMKHLRAYLAHKDTWCDIHISKLGGTDEDVKVFDALLDGIRFIEPCPVTIDIQSELQKGSRYFLERDYKKSVTHYKKVLASEKKTRTLDKNTWRVMVDNLGMAYGIPGQTEKAKEVFLYGIGEDPDYPMFHYNLSCAHAEGGDVQEAIVELKKAFALKKHMIEGERMPDPRRDSSFKKYVDTPEFKQALKDIGV